MHQELKTSRRQLIKAVAVGTATPGLLLRAGPAAAAFPDKPIRLLHATSAGGTVDSVARAMAERMGPRLGQPVVVEIRPGAAGAIAAMAVARGPKDGHLVFFGTSSNLGYLKMLDKDLPYDPVNDFTPIAIVGSVSVGIFASAASGFNNILDLIAAAKAKPGELSYASIGQLSLSHLAMEMLQQRAGIKMIHAPYAGANVNYWADLIGGRLQLVSTGVSGGLAMAKEGRVKLLAIASRERSRLLPDVPALGEVFPGLDVPAWFGFAVAASTPAPIVQKLEEVTLAALHDPSTRQAFTQITVDIADPIAGSRETGAKIRADNEMWGKVFKAAGLMA